MEIPLGIETLLGTQRQLRSDVDALQLGLLHSDLRFIRAGDFSGGREAYLFPVDMIPFKRMKIIGASVIMSFTNSSNLTIKPKHLTITTASSNEHGAAIYHLSPYTARAISVTCSHVINPGMSYNAKLCFQHLSHAALLDVASVKLYYQFI